MQTRDDSNCLSFLALGRLATGQRPANHDEAAHLARCASCTERLRLEQVKAAEAAREALPPWLHKPRRIPRRRWTVPRALVAMAATVLVTLGVGLQQQRGQVDQIKGAPEVVVAVQDANGTKRALDSFAAIAALPPGSVVQLHVQALGDPQVSLIDTDSGERYYAGGVPVTGWLPVGVEVVAGGPLRLELRVCTDVSRCTTWKSP